MRAAFLFALLAAVPVRAAEPAVVPFELLPSRHMAVQVTLNGKGPYRLVFDTGAPINLLSSKAAKDAGVLGKKPAGGLFGALGPHDVKAFQVGGAAAANVPTMVLDHPTVAAIAAAFGPLDGIVGFPFFARYAMTVDYQKKELTLVPNGYEPADVLQGMMATMLRAAEDAGKPKVAAAAGVWGFAVEKGAAEAGVTVTAVSRGGPAAAGGLEVGDRLLTLDGRWTDSEADLLLAAGLVKPGREVELVVKRGGKDVPLKVKPAAGL